MTAGPPLTQLGGGPELPSGVHSGLVVTDDQRKWPLRQRAYPASGGMRRVRDGVKCTAVGSCWIASGLLLMTTAAFRPWGYRHPARTRSCNRIASFHARPSAVRTPEIFASRTGDHECPPSLV